MTAKGAAIHRTTRCHVAGRGRRYFAEPPLDGLKPGSPGATRLSDSKLAEVSPKSSPYRARAEEMSHEAHLRKTGGRQSGHTNPVQLMPPHFEHKHDAAVATLWRALARGWPRRRPCEVGTSTRTIWLRTSARDFDELSRVARSNATLLCVPSPKSRSGKNTKILKRRVACSFRVIFFFGSLVNMR